MNYFDGKFCEWCGTPAVEHSVGSRACAEKLRDQRDYAERLALGLGELVMQHWSSSPRAPMRGLPSDWAAQVVTLRKKLGGKSEWEE